MINLYELVLSVYGETINCELGIMGVHEYVAPSTKGIPKKKFST